MKDQEVLEYIQEGKEEAIDYLYTKYYRMMLNMVLKNSGTEDEAKDIYQDALIVFWQKVSRNELTLTSKISTYLYSICLNLWRKELDRKKRLSSEEVDGEVIQGNDKKERIKIMNECIDALGDTCKNVLKLYYFDRLSMGDIAKRLGFANADTAKTKKYKCKKELDKIVKQRYTASDFMD